jgi:asparagine synthase (glutamine-hydrolysing)
MCGIIALFPEDSGEYSPDIVTGVIKAFKHLKNRGPDCGSLVFRDKEILGFRRLSIIDQSIKGEQPFYSEKSRLLCNGEIYNHKLLKKDYDIQCYSDSDCECILHLYDRFGFANTLNQLSGDYAIIISTDNNVYFARDPIGVRPLFYGYTKDGGFALASYARALTEFCSEVMQLRPGWGKYDRTFKKLELFSHNHTPYITKYIVNDLEKTVRTTLVNSVRSRLMSDRPVGCLLSGGLDSSLITSILCKLTDPSKVRTYSIGMKGSQDLKHARIVAEKLGTRHTEVVFTAEEGFEAIPHVIRDLESYDITTIRASVAMWLLAKYISDKTEDIVLLSGEGADELFCGYLYFHYAPDPETLAKESLRLVNQLYLYDVLRADRCVSSHGLELRVPFLDKEMVKLCLSLTGELRKPHENLEKFLLRKSFSSGYLPDEVLWRRKDGMSDAVSGNSGKKWFEQIQDFVDQKVTDVEFKDKGKSFPSKEAYYYKSIYNKIFPTYQPVYEYWLPKWVDCGGDPSGRILEVFDQ